MTDHHAPLTALLDGTLLPPEAPLLRPDDLGVLRGEGVFETTLVVDGVARDLDDHLARLAISAEMTGLVVPAPDRWRTGVDALVAAWTGDNQMVLRLVVSRGPESAVEPVCYLLGAPLSPVSRRQRSDGVRVLLLDRGFTARSAEEAPWLLAGAKTLSYGVNMAALRHAGRARRRRRHLPRVGRGGAGGADRVRGGGPRPHAVTPPTGRDPRGITVADVPGGRRCRLEHNAAVLAERI